MSDTEQDKELREKIKTIIIGFDGGNWYDEKADSIMQLITADRKRVALEARLDERQMLNFHRAYGKDYQATLEMLEESNDDRIAELKAQQEEV